MKSILVPTDFSPCAASGYSYAALLAEKTKAKIYLLHILDISAPAQWAGGEAETAYDAHFMMEIMKLTKSRMSKVRNNEIFKNAEVIEIIERGPIPESIFKAIQKYNIEMVVMGTHGTSGFQEKFIGSNAEKIVRNAEIPVLSVKHEVSNPKVEAIMLATDFSKETQYVLPAVSNIADLLRSRLILTKVITPNKFQTTAETNTQIETFRSTCKLKNYSTNVYYADLKEEGIRLAAGASGADIIALGTHGRHGLAHFFNGSVAEDVVSHAVLPVLTLNFHKQQLKSDNPVKERKDHKYDSDLLYQIPSV